MPLWRAWIFWNHFSDFCSSYFLSGNESHRSNDFLFHIFHSFKLFNSFESSCSGFFWNFLKVNTVWKVSALGVILILISRTRTEYGEILCISPYSVHMRENTDQHNPKYRHFLCSVTDKNNVIEFVFSNAAGKHH